MKNIIRQILKQIREDNAKRRRLRTVLLVLSLLVATGVVWQLKITGITMTGEALCGHLEHQHTESCVTKTLICQQEERAGHTHGDGCYEQTVTQICTEQTHAHTDTCFAREEKRICQLEETEGHTHGEDCWKVEWICGYASEHVHTVLCYSNSEADLERSEDWKATLPELTGEAPADLVAVAKSQLGYEESAQNYKVADDGVTKMGYTRYGEWYGNPYGNWSAMFVSFCLNYAGHPAYEDLKSSGAESMRLTAEELGCCREIGCRPQAGDLVFLDKNTDGTADAVAVVCGSGETELTAIEGDCENAVQETSYSLDAGVLMSFAQLSVEEEPDAAPADASTRTLADAAEPVSAQTPGSEETALMTADETEGNITITFVIDNAEYTSDPGNASTHITVNLTEKNNPSADGYSVDGGLTYTYWTTDSGKYKHKITGTGTLMTCSIPAGTALAESRYSLPGIGITNITGSTLSFVSPYSWITSDKMICNDDTVFTEDTTLHLSLYPSGEVYTLNWVCNCTGTDSSAGSHSVYYNLTSSYPNPSFALGESLSPNYILSAEDVNNTYTGSGESCNVGSGNNMTFTGWYLKNETTGEETDFAAGVPFLEGHVDPNSGGYTIKLYARWRAADAEMVTVTFQNGETVVSTMEVEKGSAIGTLPEAPAAETGTYFVGWQAEGTAENATAETIISADTTFHAIFANACTVTYQVDGEPYGDTVYIAPGSALGALPENPVYAGEDGLEFLGWKAEGVDGYVTEDTIITASMVLTAEFGEAIGFDVYFHDMDPDGNEVSADCSISWMVTANSAVADWLDGSFLDEDTAIADCIWYTLAGDGTKTPYDLSTPVTGEMHLYTYSYKVELIVSEASTAQASSFFLTASAVEVDVSGDTLTLTLREGETPTAADFVVNGVDYSLYTWTYTDANNQSQTLVISDIITNGVTENITATSEGTLDLTTQTITVNFFVCIDGTWTNIKTSQISSYVADGRYHLSAAQLEAVYGTYGFSASDITSANDLIFAHVDSGNTNIWSCTPTQIGSSGSWFIPGLTHGGNCDIYYLPANAITASGVARDDYVANNTFYSITIQDHASIYDTSAEVPAVSYVFTGETAEVTLLTPDVGEAWKQDGVLLTGTENEDGTTTYTFRNVTAPIVITSESEYVTVSVQDDANAVYASGEERPSVTVGVGGDVSIAVKNQAGYGWLANGKGITGGVINDEETTVTYTFTNVTEDIVLTPVALIDDITIQYSIGTLPGEDSITSTRPTIKNGETYEDAVTLSDNGTYIVLTPDKTQYTREGWVSLVTVTFTGWDVDSDGDVDLKAGQVLTAAELSAYGETVNLTAIWEDQGWEGSVSFYINLELQVLDYDGSQEDTPNTNFTGAIYGTEVKIDPAPTGSYTAMDVLQAATESETAAIDATIRTLTDGVSAAYMDAQRTFTLTTFPDDENALAQIRTTQQGYIQAYETWKTEQLAEDSAADVSVQAYRNAGNKIIWDSATGNFIPWDEITSENYTIRWYVFKYDITNGWHIDGVLVKKQGQLTITKTFYGNSTAIDTVKNSPYTISVMDGETAVYGLNLQEQATDNQTGYVNYDTSTDTYTWKIDLATNKTYNLKENNYTVAQNVVSGMSMASLAEYMVVNGDDVKRTTYPASGVDVTARAYSVDVDYTSYKTVKFYNSYIPTTAMLLRKVDDSGNTLSDVQFQLKKGDELVQMYQDADGIYYIYAETGAAEVDYITTDAFGQAIIIGLKDAEYAGEYKLLEAAAPTGYAKIEEEMAFNLDDEGNLSVVAESSYLKLLDDEITLQVTNASHTMDITVNKVWSDGTDKDVRVALYLNGAAMSSDPYEITLNGENGWTHTWTDIPAYVGGSLANYTIRETWIGDSAYSGTIDDGYENYVVTYSNPVYTYGSDGNPESLTLTVTNRTDSGEVEFTKVDHNGTGLGGAAFQLYTNAACTTAYGSSAVSDSTGKVTFGNLAAGVYYMKEAAAPTGYQANDTIYEVKVTGSGTTIKVLDTDTAITTITNIPANADLRVKKTDDKGNILTDASFELYKKNADEGWDKQVIEGKSIFTVDTDGSIDFTNLSNGEYMLVETSAPAGYYRLTEEIPFTVYLGNVTCASKDGAWTFTDGSPATITVVNVPGSELPQTGGMGTHFGTMVGLLMMAGSLLYGFLLRRKRERGAV